MLLPVATSVLLIAFAAFVLLFIYSLCKRFYAVPARSECIYGRAEGPLKAMDLPVFQVYTLDEDNTMRVLRSYEDDECMPPPDYVENGRASPLPSYEEVAYCDQLNRSYMNLLSIP